MLGAGIHGFSKPLLKAYRDAVIDPQSGLSLAQTIATIANQVYSVGEKTYKRTPRGYNTDHQLAELLLYSGLTTGTSLGVPAELYSSDLIDYCFARYKDMASIVDWLEKITRKVPPNFP